MVSIIFTQPAEAGKIFLYSGANFANLSHSQGISNTDSKLGGLQQIGIDYFTKYYEGYRYSFTLFSEGTFKKRDGSTTRFSLATFDLSYVFQHEQLFWSLGSGLNWSSVRENNNQSNLLGFGLFLSGGYFFDKNIFIESQYRTDISMFTNPDFETIMTGFNTKLGLSF